MNPCKSVLLVLAVTSPVVAQYQAANWTARRAGLEVREVEAFTNPVANLITVNGVPGAAYVTLIEVGGALDRAFAYPWGTTTSNPYIIDVLGGAWWNADPLLVPLSTGVIPPSGTVSRTFPFPMPFPAGTGFRTQVFMSDLLSSATLAISNGTIKTVTAPVPRPNWNAPYRLVRPGPDFPSDDYKDVEQGDIDGDGDHDTVLLSCGGNIIALPSVGGEIGQVVAAIGAVAAGSSIELADIDNDNWLDLVVASDSALGMAAFRNLGRSPPTGGGVVMGGWLGFSLLPSPLVAWDPVMTPFPPYALDIETADVDQDGYLDVFLSCARPQALGLPNRLLRNTLGITGALGFAEITVPNLYQTYPGVVLDDTEDGEFSDLDNDGDMDIVVANFDGPLAGSAGTPFGIGVGIGVELVHINQGFLQGGTLGTYRWRLIVSDPPDDESVDVLVKDFDGDGFDDIYVSNWYFTVGNTGPFTTPAVYDRLYLTRGTRLAWRDSSVMLPDNPNYAGRAEDRVPAWPSSDAEATDADSWKWPGWGGLDILVSSGRLCNFTVPDTTGLRLLHYIPSGVYVDDSFPVPVGNKLLPAALQTMDINDIETGDWSTTYWDKDFGLATEKNLPNTPGHVWCER